jgi:hypothetical protein
MAHDHAHHHGDGNSYYMEQLFTIAVCGAIGAVMIMLYVTGRIGYLLAASQQMGVLLGGIGLLALALVRGIYVWFDVGEKQPAAHAHDHDLDHGHCDHDHGACGNDHHDHFHHHDHEHGIQPAPSPALTSLPLTAAAIPVAGHSHDDNHDHGHHHHHHHDHGHHHGHDHGHDHDHDHGWAPWRFMLLLLPVILFMLGLPGKGIVGSEVPLDAAEMKRIADMDKANKGDKVVPLSFIDLEKASMNLNVRDDLAGRRINVEGQYRGSDPAHFTLVRLKINCCAADAIPLNAVIMVNPPDQKRYKLDPGQYNGKWVSVTGRLYFVPQPNGEYRTLVILEPSEDKPLSEFIQKLDRPSSGNEYAS